ncbi:AsmA family protein [Myxococcota bacterium]|nr:AsmA family protein [Myxococcota bacterium]
MVKKLAIGAVVGIVILVAVGVFAYFNLNALLDRNRDRIETLASEAAGRAVRFEKASVAFSKGLAIRLDGVRIAEDPRFGKTDFLSLESGFVEVALWPLLSNRIEVRGVRLEGPVIQLIDTKKGWNFSSLGASDAKPAAPAADESTPPMALVIGALAISDGTIVYSDRTAKDGLALTIEDFESSGANLTLDGPIALDFSGRVRPTTGDPVIASKLSGELAITNRATGEGKLHLASPSFFPRLVGVDLSEGEDAERIDGLDLTVGIPADASKTGYPIALQAKAARLAGFDLDAIDGKLVYRASKLSIERFATGMAGGRAELAGDLGFGAPGKAPFDLDLKVDSLDTDLLAHVLLGLPRGVVSGRIGGRFDLAGRSLDWETLTRTLAGQVRLQVDGGALESVNVLDTFVTRLVGDPGVGQLLAGSLREAVPNALSGDRTPFDLLKLAVEIQDGRLRADDLQIAAKDFGLAASGAVGLDGLLAGDGRIRFSPELSKKILKKADRFAPLLADGDVVVLPLELGGKLSAPFLRPDLSALGAQARVAATEELKEKAAKKLTDAIFGKKKNKPAEESDPAAAAADGAAQAQPSQKELEREAAKDLVKQGLGRLLGN